MKPQMKMVPGGTYNQPMQGPHPGMPINGANPNMQFFIAPGTNFSGQMVPNAFMQQQANTYRTAMALFKLTQFFEVLNSSSDQRANIEYWQTALGSFFTDNGFMKYTVSDGNMNQVFELPAAFIPRFYQTFSNSGVLRIQVFLEESNPQRTNQGGVMVECSKATVTYTMADSTIHILSGTLRVLFNPQLKIEWMEQSTHGHSEFVDRKTLIKLLENNLTINDLPKTKLDSFGLTEQVTRFLQLSETFSQMRDLFQQAALPNSGGPLKTFENFHKNNVRSIQQHQLAQQQHLVQQQQQLKQQQLQKQQIQHQQDQQPEQQQDQQKQPQPPQQEQQSQPPQQQQQQQSQQQSQQQQKQTANGTAKDKIKLKEEDSEPEPAARPQQGPEYVVGSMNPPSSMSPNQLFGSNKEKSESIPMAAGHAFADGSLSNGNGGRPSPRLANKRRRPSIKEDHLESNLGKSPKMAKKQ